MEYNRNGPSASSLAAYLEAKLSNSLTPLLDTAFFRQIIREDVIQAIEHMGSIAEVEIEVHKDRLEFFRNSAFDETLHIAEQTMPEASIIKLGFSREKGARSGEAVEKPNILGFLRRNLGEVNNPNSQIKMRVRVENQPDDSGSSVWLDVFSQKYADKVRVRLNSDKSINSESCYEQIFNIYQRRGL